MESIVEVQRQSHEEIERYEQALADVLSKPSTSSRESLRNQHKAYDILDRIAKKKKTLKEQYDDALGLRAKELAALSVPPARDHELDEFYSRFDAIKKRYTSVAGGMTAEPEGRVFVNMLKELVGSDGKERRKVDDGPDEVIDRESAQNADAQLVLTLSWIAQPWMPCSRERREWVDSWICTSRTLNTST